MNWKQHLSRAVVALIGVVAMVAALTPQAVAATGNRPRVTKAEIARVRAALTASLQAPPEGLPIDTMASCGGTPGISVGTTCDPVPNPGYAPTDNDYLQLLVLDRTSLAVASNQDLYINPGETETIDEAITGSPPNDIVILSDPDGLAARPAPDSNDYYLLTSLGIAASSSTKPFSAVVNPSQLGSGYSNYDQVLGGTPSQSGDVTGEIKGYLQQDQFNNYNFVYPDYVPFSTHSSTDAPGANTITVGSTSYPTPALSAGESGFQEVVINPDNLSLEADHLLATNGTANDATAQQTIFSDIENDVEQLNPGSGGPFADGYSVLLLQSIGHPAAAGPAWSNFASFLQEQMGGTAAIFNSLNSPGSPGVDAVTSYALVAQYAPNGSPPANRSVSDEASLAVGGPIVALKGQLARIRTSQFAPYIADNTNSLDQSLFQAAYQPATAWPYSTGPAATTVSDIDIALQNGDSNFPSGADLRDEYSQSLNNPGWAGEFQLDLKTLCVPPDNTGFPCTDPDFNAVKAQLTEEFDYVAAIHNLLDSTSSGIEQILSFAIGSDTNSLDNIASAIINSLPGGNAGSTAVVTQALSVTSTILSAAATPIGDAVGAAAIGLGLVSAAADVAGPVGIVVGVVAAVIAIVAIFTTSGGTQPSPFIGPVRDEAANLGTDLTTQYAAAIDETSLLGEMLVSDWGRMETAGPELEVAASDMGDTQTLNQVIQAYELSARQALWEVLAPVAYTRYTAPPQKASCPNDQLTPAFIGLTGNPAMINNLYYWTSAYSSPPPLPSTSGYYLMSDSTTTPDQAVLQALYDPATTSVSTPGGTLLGAGLDPLVFLAHYSKTEPGPDPFGVIGIGCSGSAVQPSAPYHLATYEGNSQSANLGSSFALPMATRVTDAFGVPQDGAAVGYQAPPSGASLTFPGGGDNPTVSTDIFGLATTPAMTANDTPGSYFVVANFDTTTAEFAEANVGPISMTATEGSGQSTPINTSFADPLVVTITEGGIPVVDQIVTFAGPDTGATASFGAGPTITETTNQNGVAFTPVPMAGGAVGTYEVVASITGATTNFTLTNTPVIPTTGSSSTALTCSPNPVTAGQPLTLTATVTSATAGLTAIPTGTVQFSVAGGNLGTPVALSGNGVATYTVAGTVTATLPVGQLSFGAVYSSDPTYTASSGGCTETIAAAGSGDVDLSIAGSGPTTVGAGQAVSLTFTVTDNSAGPSSGYVVNAAIPSTFTDPASSTSGCTVTATALACTESGLAGGASFPIVLTGTAAATLGTTSVTATVTGNDPDPVSANNSATVTYQVASVAGTPIANPEVAGGSLVGLGLVLGLLELRRRRRGGAR